MSIIMAMLGVPSRPPPAVSALGNGQVNSVLSSTCYAGVQFGTDGEEDEVNAESGAYNQNVNTWLTQGFAEDVWVERSVSAGSWNDTDPGTGRHQLSSNRNFRVIRVAVGVQSVTGTFSFYDAASGGNLLDSTSSATYSAEHDFDPCPTCCFTPDTLILMGNGLLLPIKDVQKGDLIMVFDNERTGEAGTVKYKAEAVTDVITRQNRDMYRLHFKGGHTLEVSDDHPLYVEGKGPMALNPSVPYKDIGIPDVLKVGDMVTNVHGMQNEIVKIEPIKYSGTVYTFENTLFYANGLLVY